MSELSQLPDGLPIPEDDGAAAHLGGIAVPSMRLTATTGGDFELAEAAAGRLVAFVYPRTGIPGEAPIEGWDDIPGARGCTPQSCAYRDALAEFERLDSSLVGISAQTPEEQREFAGREHIPFPLLSDRDLALAGEPLRLPTFEAGGLRLYRRLTLIAEAGRVVKVFYPVFPPDRDAGRALAWLASR